MRNQYPGTCYRCAERVDAGAGHFERYQGLWRVQHAECAIAYRGLGPNAKGPRPKRPDTINCKDCGNSMVQRTQSQRQCKHCIRKAHARARSRQEAESTAN